MANQFYPWQPVQYYYVNTVPQLPLQVAPAAKTLWFGEAPVKTPAKILKQTGTTNCCGADFVEWFPETFCSRQLREQIDTELAGHIKTANSMLLIILNNKQKADYGDLVEKHGFKKLMDGVFHPNHGNYLTLYGYERHKKDNLNDDHNRSVQSN
mgnify:FL=1